LRGVVGVVAEVGCEAGVGGLSGVGVGVVLEMGWLWRWAF